MTIELLVLMMMLGIGMKTSYLSPDTRFELLDLKERSFFCQPEAPRAEPGHLYPGKGKATNYSSDRLMNCSRRIFSNSERHSYLNFVTASASAQARRIAHSLNGLVRQNFENPNMALSPRPLAIAVAEADPALRNYLHDVFATELIAVLGPHAVSRTRHESSDPSLRPMLRIALREVDNADLLFDAQAEFSVRDKDLRWLL